MNGTLPEGTHLAYTIYHETEWWRKLCRHDRPNEGRRAVQVAASAKGAGGGCVWEFGVQEWRFRDDKSFVSLEIFGDAWQAFTQIPEFFAALASGEVSSLADVVTLLDRLGAVDETVRPDAGEVSA